MCRSQAEGGRRCPCDHAGYSSSRANRAARKQLSRMRKKLELAEAIGEPEVVASARAKLADAEQRVAATKPDTHSSDAPALAHPRPVARRSAAPTFSGPPSLDASMSEWSSYVQSVYHQLAARPDDYVLLADLRAGMSEVPRDVQDAVLRALSRRQEFNLAPDSNRKTHTAADRAAALRIGGQDQHLIAKWRDNPVIHDERDEKLTVWLRR